MLDLIQTREVLTVQRRFACERNEEIFDPLQIVEIWHPEKAAVPVSWCSSVLPGLSPDVPMPGYFYRIREPYLAYDYPFTGRVRLRDELDHEAAHALR